MRLIIAALVCVALVIGGWQAWEYVNRFDSARWKAAGKTFCEESSDRKWMVEDLREHHLKVGMSTSEVRRLLGKPRWVSGDIRGKRWGIWWEWDTGPSLLDCYTFLIRFVRGHAVEWAEGET